MQTRLFFKLTAKAHQIMVHFCESEEMVEVHSALLDKGIAVFEIDGRAITTQQDLFKAFAIALKKPEGWYGDEEYAPNANAFHEYLDDVHEWVPAQGHVAVMRGAKEFWKLNPRLAGELVEWWLFATGPRGSDIHLVFVW